jgi:integrator complex subunit 6
MLIVFIIDTSTSMLQKTNNGMSYLDIAKSSVDCFVKFRNKDSMNRSDRYFLVTCEEGKKAIKV